MMRPPSNRFRSSRNPTFRSHVRAHEAVVNNESLYGDEPPFLGNPFTSTKTAERHAETLLILLRAARKADKAGDKVLAEKCYGLHDKLASCKPRRRCGSLACPPCGRAFQKAKVTAETKAIAELQKTRSGRSLVFVTIIPRAMMYAPGQFSSINIPKANRWLKDALKKIGTYRVIMGSADLGWENRRGGSYLQLHWHLCMWTSNPKQLREKLKTVFKKTRKGERPVDVTMAMDLGFVAYKVKIVKLADLLRRARRHIPELLLTLDRTEPLEFLVLTKMKIVAQHGGFALRRIRKVGH